MSRQISFKLLNSFFIMVSIMFSSQCGYVSMLKNDICELTRRVEDWPIEQIFTNTQLDTGNADIKFFLSNATAIEECVQQCCAAESDCNLVLFVEMKMCYLIGCKSDKECILKPNHKKTSSDPVDYIIKIRSASAEDNKFVLQANEVSVATDGQKKSNCLLNSTSSGCPLNELCLMDDCVCPNEMNYVRIENVCREYLKHKSVGCSLFMSECDPNLNEECVSLSNMNRHGTCQCKVSYKRNMETGLCELFEMKYIDQKLSNKRKRPDLKPNNDLDTFDEILEALGVEPEKVLSEPGKTINPKKNTINKTVSSSTSETFHSVNAILMSTTSTKKSTTSTTTQEIFVEPTKVNTKNLIAFAGNDIHVYYPNTMVVLDGSLTRFYGADGNQGIVKWLWTKHDSSPAFGRFHQSNEKPIVVYEQLVEGVYRFILKIWSNSNEFSQDVVHVYVHSHLNSSKSISSDITDHKNHQELVNKEFINENIVQIEVDIEPKFFTESIKNSFLNKLQILLQQSDLKNPKLLLVNSKVSFKSAKSRVILELIVCEDSSSQQNEDTFDYEYLIKLSQDNIRADKMGATSRRVLRNKDLIKILKTNNQIYSVKSSINSLLNPDSNNLALNYLGMKITEIGLFTCDYSHNDTCSNHGTCDSLTGKCVCSAYWMPNLFRFYLQNESDLTNGNNCEWNVPLFITLMIMLFMVFTLIAGCILKYIVYYFFYVLCCCCCCAKKKVNKYEDFKKNKMKKYGKFDQYLEEKLNQEQNSDEEDDFNEKHKRSTFRKLTRKFRSVPVLNGKTKTHKYALLDGDDENRIMKRSKNDRMGAKLNMDNLEVARDLKHNDEDDEEEDVVFEQSFASNTNEKSKHKQPNNKKPNGFVKEYKEIV